MKIAEIRLQRYDLELVKPITVKGHALEKRSGLILSVIDSAGIWRGFAAAVSSRRND
ncbi:MAG: hypothetical protein ACYSOW_11595 [Planctomycetota bacterium]|jgi:hypothetical protein